MFEFSFRHINASKLLALRDSGVWTPLGDLPPDSFIGSRSALAMSPSPFPSCKNF